VWANGNRALCKKCYNKLRRESSQPDREKLAKLVWEKPLFDLRTEFGISDRSLAKWCCKLDIERPPNGYWNSHSKSVGT
jgi:hypothetical protein